MAVQILRRRFTVDEYHRMAEAGILTEDDRVELLEGEIVAMAPIGSRHAGVVNRLNRLCSKGVGEQAVVSIQNPIRLGEHSEPQPDVVLLRPRPDFYASSHPRPGDVLLIVEVAETSASIDREMKVPLYARVGIAEVWLVDLDAQSVEIYRRPGPQGYQEVRRVRRGERLAPDVFADLDLAVDDILG